MNHFLHLDIDSGGASRWMPHAAQGVGYDEIHSLVVDTVDRYAGSFTDNGNDALHQRRADMLDHCRTDAISRLDGTPYGQRRADAAGGMASSRDLEHRYAEVVRERHKPTNAMRLFDVDTSVPIGAETHTVDIMTEYGSAAIYRPGDSDDSSIPTVDAGLDQETFQTIYLVTSWKGSIFEDFSLQFAGRMVNKAQIARSIMERKANSLFWDGSQNDNLYGILTLPHIPKAVAAQSITASGTFNTMLQELNRLAAYASQASGGAFGHTHVAIGLRLWNLMNRIRHGQDPSLTLMKAFQETNPNLTIEMAQELDVSSTSSRMLFYEKSRQGMSIVLPAGFTILPTETRAFGRRTYCFMKLGGAVSRAPASALLVTVTISES